MPSLKKSVKRLRVFAGPNGSGKSSIFKAIAERSRVGAYINADELRRGLETDAGVSLPLFHPSLNVGDFEMFYSGHPLRERYEGAFPFVADQDGRVKLAEGSDCSPKLAYASVILADYLRTRLVEAGEDLAFETVFSHPSRLALLRQAKESGYRVYLYYVCVVSPEISKLRVALCVAQGGYGAPENKIVERYERSLALLGEAVSLSDRACLFDNSYSGASLKLEINRASEVIPHEPMLPEWITRSLPALKIKEKQQDVCEGA